MVINYDIHSLFIDAISYDISSLFIAIIVMIHHRNVLFEPSHCFTSIIAIFSNLYDKSKTEGQAKRPPEPIAKRLGV